MKVIKSKLSDTNRCTCEECGAELEYTTRDKHIGWMGVEYVTCPECNNETMVGEDRRKCKPTWPMTFHHTYVPEAVDLSDETVDTMVDKVVDGLKNSNEEYAWAMTATGTGLVFGVKTDDGIDIYVTKDYWEDTIFNN